MTFSVFLLLLQDGLSNGLIYGLLAISILLVYLVTRVLWVPAGDIIVLSALTMSALTKGQVPGTVWLMAALAAVVLVLGLVRAYRTRSTAELRPLLLTSLVYPVVLVTVSLLVIPMRPPVYVQIALTLLLIAPIGVYIYRVAFERLINASPLILLFVAVAVHYALTGLALLLFGAEGYRTPPIFPGRFDVGVTRISWQTVFVVVTTAITIACLWYFFSKTLWGKSLRATSVNRLGAQLVGLQLERNGMIAFGISAVICAISGILIGPIMNLYYDSGFVIGLKGFIGVVLGGMISFPIAALGSLGVGVVEVMASFFASSYRDVIVFSILVPVLLISAFFSKDKHEEDGDE